MLLELYSNYTVDILLDTYRLWLLEEHFEQFLECKF